MQADTKVITAVKAIDEFEIPTTTARTIQQLQHIRANNY